MVMYGIYNAENLEKLLTTVHQMHNITTPNVRLFASKFGSLFICYLTKDGVDHYAISTVLYLRTLRVKYVIIYEEVIIQL